MTPIEIDTPHGLARAHVQVAPAPHAALVLGHGAAGGPAAPDLRRVAEVALSQSVSVALVEQPYRVAGRRSPAPARQLDAAWIAVVEQLEISGPLIVGGRSSGARVACRTAADVDADGVLCLAFPLHPPRSPETTRLPELEAVAVPVLVVQGDRDPFGVPPHGPRRAVVLVAGDHALRRSLDQVGTAAQGWLSGLR